MTIFAGFFIWIVQHYSSVLINWTQRLNCYVKVSIGFPQTKVSLPCTTDVVICWSKPTALMKRLNCYVKVSIGFLMINFSMYCIKLEQKYFLKLTELGM